MLLFEVIAEQRIAEAQARGEFERLPGAGVPLALDDADPLVPEDVRVMNRVLKNAGLVPPEVVRLRELRRLDALRALQGGHRLRIEARYARRVLDRLLPRRP